MFATNALRARHGLVRRFGRQHWTDGESVTNRPPQMPRLPIEQARLEAARISGIYREPGVPAQEVLADLMRTVSSPIG